MIRSACFFLHWIYKTSSPWCVSLQLAIKLKTIDFLLKGRLSCLIFILLINRWRLSNITISLYRPRILIPISMLIFIICQVCFRWEICLLDRILFLVLKKTMLCSILIFLQTAKNLLYFRINLINVIYSMPSYLIKSFWLIPRLYVWWCRFYFIIRLLIWQRFLHFSNSLKYSLLFFDSILIFIFLSIVEIWTSIRFVWLIIFTAVHLLFWAKYTWS